MTDSICFYATWPNLLCLTAVLGAGAMLPFLLRRAIGPRCCIAGAILLPLGIILGAAFLREVETLGLHRNPLIALATSMLPRLPAHSSDRDWRGSPYPSPAQEDLTSYRGLAAGRNVVMIHLESTASQYLRAYGAMADPMPNVTRLAESAIVFDHAYAAYPESIKGLFAVLCSTFPALDTAPEIYANVRTPSLAEVLGKAGYRTGLFHSGRFMYLGMESVVQNRGYDTLEDAGAIGGEIESSFGVDEPSTVRRITSWIDRLPRGQRFLVTYLPIAGHHPYATPGPGPFPGEEPIDQYRNALHYADEAVGMLVEALKTRGLDRETLIVLLGDHGEAFGQHPGNIGHTLFVYEENVRVPLLFVLPGPIEQPVRVHRIASSIDVAPTILDLLGLPAPAAYQGTSLLEPDTRVALMFTDYSLGYLALRDDRWKCIHQIESGRTQLFDLDDDPNEQNDRASRFPERTAKYRDQLRGWCQSQRAHVQKLAADKTRRP